MFSFSPGPVVLPVLLLFGPSFSASAFSAHPVLSSFAVVVVVDVDARMTSHRARARAVRLLSVMLLSRLTSDQRYAGRVVVTSNLRQGIADCAILIYCQFVSVGDRDS